jgi:hypothetical protein
MDLCFFSKEVKMMRFSDSNPYTQNVEISTIFSEVTPALLNHFAEVFYNVCILL